VGHSIFIGHFDLWRRSSRKQDLLRGQGRIGVQHENLSEVGPRRAQQVQPVRLGFGKRLFVAENHLLAVIAHFAQADERPALMDFSLSLIHI